MADRQQLETTAFMCWRLESVEKLMDYTARQCVQSIIRIRLTSSTQLLHTKQASTERK